jgi:class 3 adenylate cyclase
VSPWASGAELASPWRTVASNVDPRFTAQPPGSASPVFEPSSVNLAAPLPTGAVTFAFTDIEGSTVRWERDRAAMQAAVRRHDAILRAAITEYGGHVFKTIGDAFCAAFARPQDAVAAMLAAQWYLSAEDFSAVDGLRIRSAIHSGTTDERDGDYFGPALNRVARLLESAMVIRYSSRAQPASWCAAICLPVRR